MPQFDFVTFSVQIFWTTIFMFTMHLVYLYYFLPHTASVLKFRERLIAQSKIEIPKDTTRLWNKSFIIK